MASLADQLAKVQLKKSKTPIKDYSSPKTAGYISQEEIKEYQSNVLDVNIELWIDILKEETFPTVYCPMTVQEAELFVAVYEREFSKLEAVKLSEKCQTFRSNLSTEENEVLKRMEEKLQAAMQTFTKDGAAFVKTSCRSAKDAPLYQTKFKELFLKYLEKYPEADRKVENAQITSLLQAGFEALKVTTASEVLAMFLCSERIYQDMMLALNFKERFQENFVIRQFFDIDVDMEFRGFVSDGTLTALSQYNYLIHSQRLEKERENLSRLLKDYFDNTVCPKLKNSKFPKSYIIDFAICNYALPEQKIWVIEINPFMNTTDGALFSWEHELHLLEDSKRYEFRVALKPKPGSKSMLTTVAKEMLKEYNEN